MTWAGNTRRTRKTGSALPVSGADAPMSVRKLFPGGRGGRYTSGNRQTKDNEVRDSNSWNFHGNTSHKPQRLLPLTSMRIPPTPQDNIQLCLPISSSTASPPAPEAESAYVLVSLGRLKKAVSEHVQCKTCSHKFYHERQVQFGKFCDEYNEAQWEEVMGSDKTDNQKLVALRDVLLMKTHKLWKNSPQ